MTKFLNESDPGDPQVQEAILRNQKICKEAMRLIAKRHRNLPPQKGFEAIANTIGLLCAELMLSGENIGGRAGRKAMQDLLMTFMERANVALDAAEPHFPSDRMN